ncbi:unnamed protein product [Anisakis simplex]|uniref:Ion_trans domain-containing protein n=1 Tax=Anisakis simplex TaxID=6269 RepID=A0A0M3JY43_ANISI|nr:unnamed protein product [Anisakis simplex]
MMPHSRCTREFYNSRTRKIQTEEQLVYLFKYERGQLFILENSFKFLYFDKQSIRFYSSVDREEVITWRELKSLFVKGAVKLQVGKVSKWFIFSYLFNITTYFATFLFIWTPMLFAYDDYNRDLKIAIIWVPTLLAFAFAFHLVMRNSGTEPWEASDALMPNATVARQFLAILQAITKTSTMMIGEIDADNVLERKEWIPNLLLLVFEITTVILLMNLMVAFTIEMLQLSEKCQCRCTQQIKSLHQHATNNVLVIDNDGQAFTAHKNFDFTENNAGINSDEGAGYAKKDTDAFELQAINNGSETLASVRYSNYPARNTGNSSHQYAANVSAGTNPPSSSSAKIYHIQFPNSERRMRIEKYTMSGRTVPVTVSEAFVQLIESVQSGIEAFNGTIEGRRTKDVGADPERFNRKFARWLIGLDWSNLLDT